MRKETKKLLNHPEVGVQLNIHEARQIEVLYNKEGDVLFQLKAFRGLPCRRVRLEKLPENETAFQRHRFKKESKQKIVVDGVLQTINLNILRLHQEGVLKDKMTPAELAMAAQGILPKGWGFHHWHAIAMGGDPSDKRNLILIQKGAHKLTHLIMDSLLKYVPEKNRTRRGFYLDLPELPSVINNEMFGQMLKMAKAIQQQKEMPKQLEEKTQKVVLGRHKSGVIRQRYERGLGWHTIG